MYHLQSNFEVKENLLSVKSYVEDLKEWFLRRDYRQPIVEEQVNRVFELSLEHNTQQIKKESGIQLFVTYNSAFKSLSKLLRKSVNILYLDAEVRKTFRPSPFIACRSARNPESFR